MADHMLSTSCPTCFGSQPTTEQERAIRRSDRKLTADLIAAELGDNWGERVAKVFRDPRARAEFTRLASAINLIAGDRLVDISEHHDPEAWR